MSFYDPKRILAHFQAAQVRQSDRAGPARNRILVVDDQAVLRELLAEHLALEGYEVSQAPNAFQALAALSSGEAFDLLITDIDMPGDFDGLTLARLTKEAIPATKVIVLSGSARLAGKSWFVDGFIRKPATSYQIRRHVGEILGCATNRQDAGFRSRSASR